MLPSQYLSLDQREKAFIVASIQIKIDNDKKAAAKAKREAR